MLDDLDFNFDFDIFPETEEKPSKAKETGKDEEPKQIVKCHRYNFIRRA